MYLPTFGLCATQNKLLPPLLLTLWPKVLQCSLVLPRKHHFASTSLLSAESWGLNECAFLVWSKLAFLLVTRSVLSIPLWDPWDVLTILSFIQSIAKVAFQLLIH